MTRTLVRAFASDIQQTDTRTLTARLVPWDKAAPVADVIDGRVERYMEGFRRGAADRQVNTSEPGVIRRVQFVHTHDGGLGFLGSGAALRDEDDGLWGDFSILRSRADDVADLLEQGVKGVSIEFVVLRGGTSIDDAGVRWRTAIHLDRVALEPQQAYKDAVVASFRAEVEDLEAEEAERAAHEAEETAKAQQRAELQAWLAEQEAERERLRNLAGL